MIVFKCCLKSASDEVEVMSVGGQFRMWAPATGKARRPTVDKWLGFKQ